MKKSALKKKPVQLALVLGLVAAIVLSGTFAWYSFNQSRVNVFNELMTPDTNLHDDFAGGPNKDVYVENSGSADIFVRVRLTEFLQTDNRGSLVEGHLRDETKAKWWAPHNGVGGDPAKCELVAPDANSPEWGSDNFHDYYSWVLGGAEGGNAGGQIYYKPATLEQKGEYGPDGEILREPVVVSDPLTETSPKLDAHLDYADQVAALMGTGKTEEEAMEALGLKKTLPLASPMISMTDWINGNPDKGIAKLQTGDFWIIDEADGWCYWANALPGGEATGLLLDRVDRTEKTFDSNAEYCINVWLQAVDAGDMGRFEMNGNGGISDNAKKLLQLATGKTVAGEDGALYQNNGDGIYTMILAADGSAPADAKPFVVLAVDAEGKSLGVNAPEASRIEIGQRVTLTELVWDGTDYTNYAAVAGNANDGWYNLTKTTATDNAYELTGTQKGQDGKLYLVLAPVVSDGGSGYIASTEDALYLGSVVKGEAKAAGDYHQGNPGSGPYAVIYLGNDGRLGTGDDLRLNPSVTVEGKFFYNLGNGVYIQVAETGSTTPIKSNEGDADITYFFAGKSVTAADSGTAVNSMFPWRIMRGANFTVNYGTGEQANTVTSYASNGGPHTMVDPVKGIDGNLYVYLGSEKDGYISVGSDNFLGNAGDTRRWPGRFGIGGTDDSTTPPSDFTESFLNGKTSEELVAGATFEADGYTWVVLDTDAYGNRLIMTTTTVASMGARASTNAAPAYSESLWPARATAFVNGLTTLKQYAHTAVLPAEPVYAATENKAWTEAGIPATDGLSSCTTGTTGTLAFPLSAGEYIKYIVNNSALSDYKVAKDASGAAVVSGLRSRQDSATSGEALSISKTGTTYSAYARSGYSPRMAMWVRFSDADSIATGDLSKWEAGIPASVAVGMTLKLDGYDWVVLDQDSSGNLLLSTSKTAYTTQANSSRPTWNYATSLLKSGVEDFYNNKLSALKSYAKNVTTDMEPAGTVAGGITMGSWSSTAQFKTWATAVNAAQAHSVVTSGSGTAFVLSASDINELSAKYPGGAAAFWSDYLTDGNSCWLRTRGFASSATAILGGDGSFLDSYSNYNSDVRPALWVNFG